MSILRGRERWHDAVVFPGAQNVDAMRELQVTRLLLIGETQLHAPSQIDVRRADEPPDPPTSSFAFEDGDGFAMLAVEPRQDQADPLWASMGTAHKDHPAIRGRRWFEYLWKNSSDAGPAPRYAPGEAVLLAGDRGPYTVVRAARRSVEGWIYRLSRHGQAVEAAEGRLTLAAAADDDIATWLERPAGGADDLALTLAYTKLSNPLTDTVYAYRSTKTLFRSYQFRPLLRLLASPHQRMLIADEVGLGKTIEAGLIWTELDQRVELRRALVVCPATLVHKWRDEMLRRFDRRLRVMTRADLPGLVDSFRSDDPTPFHGVISLESLRTALPDLEELNRVSPRFDLVVVDEAHYLRNGGTRSYTLGKLLSDWADVLLFLSATPLNLGQDDLFNLLNLLAEDEFSDRAVFGLQMEPNRHLNALARKLLPAREQPRSLLPHLDAVAATAYGAITAARPEYHLLRQLLDRDAPLRPEEVSIARRQLAELNTLASVLTRTRKADTHERKVVRSAWPIDVEWTNAEASLYAAVRRWASKRALLLNGVVGFSTQMPLRQAASCLPALVQLLEDKHGLSGWRSEGSQEDEDLDDIEMEAEGVGQLTDEDTLGRSLDELEADVERCIADLGLVDRKFDRFVEELARLRQAGVKQVMVFSFFRRTLEYLGEQLGELGESLQVMHGGVPMHKRIDMMAAFRNGDFDILLLSEVGSEGLDFEFCQALVNYDLPWNPMRVEQRIGRLDRFGQRHERIFIMNFHVPGTIETEIFDRLYQRIGVFESSIGELEPILRDEVSELTTAALDPRLTDAERGDQVTRIAVALEAKRHDLDDLHAQEGYLAGLDQLLIEGFERETEAQGRFVGAPELRRILQELFAGTGARLKAGASGVEHLTGTPELSQRLVAARARGGASKWTPAELSKKFLDELPLPVTFDNEVASKVDADLISLRHPLVLAAVAHLAGDIPALYRHAAVRIEGQPGGHYLVGFWVAQTTGLRTALELWSVAVNIETGKVVEEIGPQVLGAGAHGQLQGDATTAAAAVEPVVVCGMLAELDERRRRAEVKREEDNNALVEVRIRASKDSVAIKIRRAQETLERVSDQSIRRLHEGRIRNLEHRLQEDLADLEQKRALAITVQPVALATVEVVEPKRRRTSRTPS